VVILTAQPEDTVRPFRVSNLVIGILIPAAPSAAAQVNTALRDYVELRIEVKHWAPDARVRLTFLEGPDSLRGVVRNVPVRFVQRIPGQSLKVRVEAVAVPALTTVHVEAWRSGELVSEGSVTGGVALVHVDRGFISVSTSPPGVWQPRFF
jgi:hypothetical protein